MPSIAKSLSVVLLVGATANVFAAPSRRQPGGPGDLSGVLGGAPSTPATPRTGSGLGRAIGSTTSQVLNTTGQIVSTSGSALNNVTTDLINNVASGLLPGNTNPCMVSTPNGSYTMLGACGKMSQGNQPLSDQVKQCLAQETDADRKAIEGLCPKFDKCHPDESVKVWEECMLNLCRRDSGCYCRSCLDPPPCQTCKPDPPVCKNCTISTLTPTPAPCNSCTTPTPTPCKTCNNPCPTCTGGSQSSSSSNSGSLVNIAAGGQSDDSSGSLVNLEAFNQ